MHTPEGMAAAKAWTQRTIDALPPGGVWMIPRAMTAYSFDKEAKTYRRTIGDGDGATEIVLHAMGWTQQKEEVAQ